MKTIWKKESEFADGSGGTFFSSGIRLKDGWGRLCYWPLKKEAWFWDTAFMEGEVTHFRCKDWETAEMLKYALNTGDFNHAAFESSEESKNKINLIKNMREISGCGLEQCKKALEANNWDSKKALDSLAKN